MRAVIRQMPVPKQGTPDQTDIPVYVTLSQIARAVRKGKSTLRNFITTGEFPPCEIEGGGGKSAYWIYDKVRPRLTEQFGMFLPEQFREDAIPPRPHVPREMMTMTTRMKCSIMDR